MSLITPALMLIIAALDFARSIQEAVVENYVHLEAGPFWPPWLVPFLGGPATMMIGWLAVVLLGLTGRRRAAAAIASIALALALFDLLTPLLQNSAWSGGLPMFLITAGQGPVAIASLAACSLAFSVGPRRGLAIVGRRQACLLDISFLTIAVAVGVTHVRDTVDRRVAALIAPVLLVAAASIPFEFKGISRAIVVLSLASLLFAVIVWPVAIASWRGRVRRSSHALPA